MEVLVIFLPVALGLALVGLLAFLWSLRSDQYDDLDGAAWRPIADDEPLRSNARRVPSATEMRSIFFLPLRKRFPISSPRSREIVKIHAAPSASDRSPAHGFAPRSQDPATPRRTPH